MSYQHKLKFFHSFLDQALLEFYLDFVLFCFLIDEHLKLHRLLLLILHEESGLCFVSIFSLEFIDCAR